MLKAPSSLLQHPSAHAFLCEFQEEHLSEIEFLLGQRQWYLHNPKVSWPDTVGLEHRIEAHADAMRASGTVALELAREAMASGDEAQVMAGAHVVASYQERDGADGLGEAVHTLEETAEDLLHVFEEVLVLSEHPRVAERTNPLLASPRPEVRSVAARILGRRHEVNVERILPLLDEASAEVRQASVMALARLGYRPAHPPPTHRHLSLAALVG